MSVLDACTPATQDAATYAVQNSEVGTEERRICVAWITVYKFEGGPLLRTPSLGCPVGIICRSRLFILEEGEAYIAGPGD